MKANSSEGKDRQTDKEVLEDVQTMSEADEYDNLERMGLQLNGQ